MAKGYRSEGIWRTLIGILDYWYGKGVGKRILGSEPEEKNWYVEIAPTGKLRRIFIDEQLAFTLRPKDFYPVPYDLGARLLHEALPFMRRRVVVNEEQEKFVLQKRSVLAKFVLDADPVLRPGDYVLIVNRSDELLALGQMIVPARIIKDLERGFAVETKKVLKK
jgi:7-cyano-7-deazaguanine tRNA-ribosyltransferase